tara:strand:- start:184 stop:1560 length:1377 start_codon:yes stop_codon:yes gene_type:complete
MKKLFLILIITIASSCSFDNKTGIWQDASDIPVNNQVTKTILDSKPNQRYEDIFIEDETFNEEKEATTFSNVKIEEPTRITNWLQEYATPSNNVSNFSYSDNRILLYKSSKLSNFLSSKKNLNKKIIFHKNNFISHDDKGKIFIFSISLNKKIFEFDFYKRNFKKFNKKINFIVNDNILYAADNLGYIYAINLDKKSLIWAKNYGIPFRSNLKFVDNQIILANQDNVIYSISSKTGEKNWQFATSLTFLKSDFINNFAIDLAKKNIFFLNTSGELFSINYLTKKINWVLNFKNLILAGNATEIFFSKPLVVKNNDLIVTTEKAILSYNSQRGSKNWDFTAEPVSRPIMTLKNTYAMLKNDLLICLDSLTGEVIWSKNIFNSIKNNKIINKFGSIIDFKIANSEINVYSENGFVLRFDPSNGNLNSQNRISKKGIISEVFFLDDNMFFIDSNNKLLKFN